MSHVASSTAIRPLDLTGRERQLRAAMSAMGRIASNFCRAARRTLPFLIRERARLTAQPVSIDVESGGDATQPRVVVSLEADDAVGWGAVTLDADAISLILEGSLGASGVSEANRLGSDLTVAQRALVTRVAGSLAGDFARAVREEAGLALGVVSLQVLPAGESSPDAPTDGLYVRCEFEGIGTGCFLTVSVSAEALESAARERGEEQEPAHGGDPRVAEAVCEVPVTVVAELGRVKRTLRQILALKPGDVLRLATAIDDSVPVRVGSVQKLSAAPVISRGQLAVEIRGRHDS